MTSMAPAAPTGKPRCCHWLPINTPTCFFVVTPPRQVFFHSCHSMWGVSAGMGCHSCRNILSACCHSPARRQHRGLPGGAAGAMDVEECVVFAKGC